MKNRLWVKKFNVSVPVMVPGRHFDSSGYYVVFDFRAQFSTHSEAVRYIADTVPEGQEWLIMETYKWEDKPPEEK